MPRVKSIKHASNNAKVDASMRTVPVIILIAFILVSIWWFVCLLVRAVTGNGATIGTGDRVARIILRFTAFSSAALIL